MIRAILVGGPHGGYVIEVRADCVGFLVEGGGYRIAAGQQARSGKVFRWVAA